MFSRRRGQAYSQDLRERVLAADDLSARQAAARFGVSGVLFGQGTPAPRAPRHPHARPAAVVDAAQAGHASCSDRCPRARPSGCHAGRTARLAVSVAAAAPDISLNCFVF